MSSILRFRKSVISEPVSALDIYEGEPRLLAPWYFYLRATEETARCSRYDRKLALIVLEPAVAARGDLREWLSTKLRNTDLACQNEGGVAFLLLPEADHDVAAEVANRLLADFPNLSMLSAVFRTEPLRFKSLMAPLGQSRTKAA